MTQQGFQGLSNFQPWEKERDPLGERKTASGLFLESADNFTGPKENFKIKTCWIISRFLAHRPVKFVLLTDNFIVSFSKPLKLWSWM